MCPCSNTLSNDELIIKPLQEPDDNLFIWIRCAGAGRPLKHAGQRGLEVTIENHWYTVWLRKLYGLKRSFEFNTSPTHLSLSPPLLLSTQVMFSLRTFPSWPQCAPSPASSPFCCLFIMNRESSSSVWSSDAHLSSCMRIRMASRPRTTTLCSVLSTLLTESTSYLKYPLLYMT